MRTYGTIKYFPKQKYWHIDAEPHVVMRVRRMFPRAVERPGAVTIQDAMDVCRDLVWLMQRYPLEASDQDRTYLEQRGAEHDMMAETAGRLLSGTLDPRAFDLAVPAREYQKVAADLALRVKGLLIADSVGLGKTCTSICALTDPATRPALVVTMTHLPRQWEGMIKRFAPHLTTHILKKGTPYPFKMPDVIISNYHKLSGWRGELAGKVNTVVFDECQELRRGDSLKYDAARAIAAQAEYRIGLSATPIYNLGGEFYNVFQVLRPDALGSRAEFLREWCGGYEDQQGRSSIAKPAAFGAYLRDQCMMIRRTREDVKRELPPVTKIAEYVDSDHAILDAVEGAAAELAKFLLERQGTRHERMQAGGELDWKMRQATGLAKARYVADFVQMLVESGEKVVLFGWHHAVYDVWMERLTAAGCKPVLYTGEQSATQKEAAKAAFCGDGANVLIMSLRSGAGLDGLQHVCNTVVHGELDWSPAVMEQCTGRVARDEQQSPVAEYYLISDEGSDPVISDSLGVKRGQILPVLGENLTPTLTDGNGIRKLAEALLKKRGITIQTPLVEEADIL